MALNDAEAIVVAIGAGLGRSLLPRAVGDGIAGPRRLASDALLPPPKRDLWLLIHPGLRRLARAAAAAAWTEQIAASLEAGGAA